MDRHWTGRVLGWTVWRGCLAALMSALSAAAVEIEPLWVVDPDMIMEGAAVAVDLDGDGDDEVLTAAYEHLIAIDGTGEIRWRFDTRGRFSTCPAVLVREGQPPLIFAGDNKGLFTCLDGAGDVVWQAETAPIFCASPALADLGADGTLEVIQGDKSGTVHVFDALTGEPVWTKALEGECASPAVGDLDGDGAPEIVMATGAGKVYVLSGTGEQRARLDLGGSTPDWATSSPIVFGTAAGEARIVAASSLQRLWCFDGDGSVLWERPTRGAVASALSVGDMDGDGRADLFAVTQLGHLHRFDEDGRSLWDIDTQGRSLASGALVDLDGDGTAEFVLCTQNGSLLVFNEAGDTVFNHQFPNRTINMTVAPGDLLKDRPGLEFAVTGGESGLIYAFGAPGPADGAGSWRTYRGDLRLTGSWFGLSAPGQARMRPENLAWDQILTGAPVVFVVDHPRPGDAHLVAEAHCVGPDGARQAAVGKVVGRHGRLHLPLRVSGPGAYRFEWSLTDAAGTSLAAGAQAVTLQPYANDRALAARAVMDLRAAAGSNPEGFKAALQAEADAIAAEAEVLAALYAAAPGAPGPLIEDLDARTAALNERAERALALAAHGIQMTPIDAARHTLFAFEGTQWENRDIDRQVPPALAGAQALIRRRGVSGEREPVSVKLFNGAPQAAKVRAKATVHADGPGTPVVTLYRVDPVPTNQGTVAWDPLVPFTGDAVLEIPSLETREVWVDIDLAGVRGRPRVNVDFVTDLAQAGAQIELEVLPFDIAPPNALRLCAWATYNEHAVRDLLAHGNTVFVTALPPAQVQGDRVDLDFAALDAFLAPMAGHDVFLLMSGMPDLGVPRQDPDYVPRLATYLEALMDHLAAKGIGEDRVALYPHDEPGGHGWDTVNDYIAFARLGLAARPGLQFYVNGGGDLAMFKALDEVASIWCPSFYMLPDASAEMEFLRQSGKTLWTYDCGYGYSRPIGANTKTTNVVVQYRMPAVHAVHFGAEGIGFWCYNVGPSMWGPIQDEYPLVYQNDDGTITSCRRWEAVRESMEDARILLALRDKLSDAAVGEEARVRIRALFDTVAEMSRESLQGASLGLARYVLDDANNDRTVEDLREAMMDCVELVGR